MLNQGNWKMPLKPGQIKDLKVKFEKLKGLEALEKKLRTLNDTRFQFDNMYIQNSDTYKFAMQEFDAIILKIKNEIDKTKQQIATLQATKTVKNPAVDKLIKAIAKECSQVIPFYRKTETVLLRGTNGKPKAFMGRSLNNREPKDSSSDAQRIYDTALKSMGFKALRSNSIFTTTDSAQSVNYGNVYYIFRCCETFNNKKTPDVQNSYLCFCIRRFVIYFFYNFVCENIT
jgi:hypothetical protein